MTFQIYSNIEVMDVIATQVAAKELPAIRIAKSSQVGYQKQWMFNSVGCTASWTRLAGVWANALSAVIMSVVEERSSIL